VIAFHYDERVQYVRYFPTRGACCDGVDGVALREPMHQHVAFECVFRVEPDRMLNVSDACKRNGAPVVAIAREQHISNRFFLVNAFSFF
jgi:hypothetical protein